ncbi:hypothetical protein, partial [Aliiroseovarius halocynthiae]|uniref:hypothetical protein n=1 Tax=Aliiroseovarius halocynthiae TaxID=985055 RepID=UPI001C8F31AE
GPVQLGRLSETVYVNQFYITRGVPTARKYYFAGAKHVASKMASQPYAASAGPTSGSITANGTLARPILPISSR